MAKKKPEETTTEPETTPTTEKITQREAVRRALAAGKDQPKDGIAYIKDTFNKDLTNGTFSTLKSQLKNENGKTPGKRGRKPGQTLAAVPAPVAARVSKPSGNTADLVRGLKDLITAFGAEAVKDVAAVLAE